MFTAVEVNVEVGLVGVVTVPPAPLTIVHIPVPAGGAVAPSVTEDVQPLDLSVPAFAVALAFTLIVNVTGVPVQIFPALVYDGVTVIVAVLLVVPLLIAVKDGIFPVPLAASPILVLLFDHA